MPVHPDSFEPGTPCWADVMVDDLEAVLSFLIFIALSVFFKKSIIGKIEIAELADLETGLCLGIDINKYFAIVFILGSALASLGGILYGPISTVHPYMGFRIVTLCFAVVIVGGMGNLRGTAVASYALGMVMAVTAWYGWMGVDVRGYCSR